MIDFDSIPSASALFRFIEDNFSRDERIDAFQHAWRMYMDLADMHSHSSLEFGLLYRNASVMMGCMWALRAARIEDLRTPR